MSLANIIITLANIYSFAILIYCILSWFPIPQNGVMADIDSFFEMICEPFLKPFRKLIPSIGGAVDISPILALVVLQLVVGLVVRFL